MTSIRVFSYILLPRPWYNFVQNVISSSVGGIDYFRLILSKSAQCSREEKEMSVLAQNIGTAGHSENIIASAAHSSQGHK